MRKNTRRQKIIKKHWILLPAPRVARFVNTDVLNNMIMPRYWKNEGGKHYMQYVSHHKSERSDVVRLK